MKIKRNPKLIPTITFIILIFLLLSILMLILLDKFPITDSLGLLALIVSIGFGIYNNWYTKTTFEASHIPKIRFEVFPDYFPISSTCIFYSIWNLSNEITIESLKVSSYIRPHSAFSILRSWKHFETRILDSPLSPGEHYLDGEVNNSQELVLEHDRAAFMGPLDDFIIEEFPGVIDQIIYPESNIPNVQKAKINTKLELKIVGSITPGIFGSEEFRFTQKYIISYDLKEIYKD